MTTLRTDVTVYALLAATIFGTLTQ